MAYGGGGGGGGGQDGGAGRGGQDLRRTLGVGVPIELTIPPSCVIGCVSQMMWLHKRISRGNIVWISAMKIPVHK